MPKEMLTLYTKLFVNRGNGDENLIDLLSTPDLGIGDPEKVEVTNLQDGTRRYINGLKDVGDSLEFEFNYTTDGYEKLKEIEESKEIYIYKVVLPDELCFEFEAALSTKITGAAVGEQIKMTINLTPYSTIKVGQYGENNGTSQVNEYSTFMFRGSQSASESATYNARNAGMLIMVNNTPNSITELYVNDVPQQTPQISAEEINEEITDGDDTVSLVSVLQVSEGDIIKVKGGFSLMGNALFENIINISDIKLQDNLEDCSYMFMGCTTLTEAPVIPSSVKNCTYMFASCENLAVIPQENIDLINNPPEGLIFENCFKNCPLVADQIPTNWGGNKVEKPEKPEIPTEEYTTFIIKRGGIMMISIDDVAEPAMMELYVDDEQQELPEEHEIHFFVEEGQEVKIKGHFRLIEGDIANVKLQSNLTDCSHMFEGRNLLIAPEIPEGVTNCESMFRDCRDLLIAPTIPSTVTNCREMFWCCENLEKLPQENINLMYNHPEELEHDNCYGECRMIRDIVLEDWGGERSQKEMPEEFEEYTTFIIKHGGDMRISIKDVAEPAITELYINGEQQKLPEQQELPGYYETYDVREGQEVKIKGHFKLRDANIARVKLQSNLAKCNSMFESCGLSVAPEIPEGVTSCKHMFSGCSNLLTAPIIPSTVTSCKYMFNGCENLTEAPVIPNSVTDCKSMFGRCTSLTEAPIIPSSVTDCNHMFEECRSLTTLPSENVDLMYNHNDELDHSSCYYECVNIINPITYDEIPHDWK